ncbi:DUF222 domain-containing protein [Nocardia sp. NBC_00511]|uniref:DUF222 domain-containing protein n=1 Tax=Nocardia sp. NBC_00511 TaxID=2903591 RepID=UPI0030E5C792
MADDMLIGGESRKLLMRAVARMSMTTDSDGWGRLSGALPADLMVPFARALLRIEAELLLHDADEFTAQDGEPRTQDERRADAFTALLLRLSE